MVSAVLVPPRGVLETADHGTVRVGRFEFPKDDSMFHSWLNRFKFRHLLTRHRNYRGATVNVCFRPRVEELENRLVPAAVTWIGGASGSWATGTNWSTGTMPGAGDDVVLDGSVTVSHSAGADAIQTLSLGPGAILQVVGDSSITATATGGPQVTDDGIIDLGDNTTAGGLFVNAAAASVAGTGDIVFGASAANQLGQQLGQALALGPGVTVHGQSGAVGLASGALDNQGTIRSEVAGGTITINPSGSFTNDGTVAALNGGTTVLGPGALTNLSSGTLTGGTWEAVAGGTLRGLASGIATNAATLLLDGADSNFDIGTGGSADALAALGANAAGGTFTIQNGRNFLSANPFTNAGTVVIGSGSTLDAVYTQTGGATTLQGGNLANFGPPPGNSLSFNGASAFVQVPNSASLSRLR
jgi:hypothetical protein